MKQVSEHEFFQAMGPLRVHPVIVNKYEPAGRGYVSEWRMQDTGQLAGTVESGDFPFTPPKYAIA